MRKGKGKKKRKGFFSFYSFIDPIEYVNGGFVEHIIT